MSRRAGSAALVLVMALGACSSSAPAGGDGAAAGAGAGTGTVSGTIMGAAWTKIASAYWIGTPAPPSGFLFLFERPTACASITSSNWDKVIGNEQLLEIELHQVASRMFRVPADAGVAYLRGNYNPSAESGTVTVTSVAPQERMTGSFQAAFAGDPLSGTFDAAYCAAGVEP